MAGGGKDTWTRFAESLFRLNGILIDAGDEITWSIGQSSARWQVLGRAHEPRTVASIARDIGNARQIVQRIADALAEEGLVAYRDNPDDRRARLLELTPAGAEAMKEIYARQVQWSRQVMAGLDPAQLARIADELEAISDLIEGEDE